ncbi:hypothetical protein Z949_341 [Sulfitobacter guttiformis KCTC 32187]|nr:hypothetical protein Z949_341 [Sulfitobacter guttiformis KCTC 32187]
MPLWHKRLAFVKHHQKNGLGNLSFEVGNTRAIAMAQPKA